MLNLIAYLFFTISGLFLMKWSGVPIYAGYQSGSFELAINGKMLLALVFYGTSFLIWTGIVAKNDLSFIVPFTSAIVNISSVVLGLLIFQEQMNMYKLCGIVLAVSGVVLMNWK